MNQLEDSTQVAVPGRLVNRNMKLCRRDAAAVDARPFDSRANGEGFEGVRDSAPAGACIRKGAGQHVSGKPGKRVDITNRHGYFSLGDGCSKVRWPERSMYTRQGRISSAKSTYAREPLA
jgi:hypothetical protein